MTDIDVIRTEIQHMRSQVQRQRGEIRQLRWAGIPSSSAELLEKMRNKIDELRAERDTLKREQPGHNKGKVLGHRW
jgi:phage shock protein A